MHALRIAFGLLAGFNFLTFAANLPRDGITNAFQQLDAGAWVDAARILDQPELSKSRDPRYFAAKARLIQALQGFERAAEPAQQSVGIDDHCVEGIAQQAAVYLDAGTLEDAEKWIRRAIATNAKFAYSYHLLSRLQEQRGAMKDARLAGEMALVLNPRLSEGYLQLGELYRREGRYAEALRLYRRAFDQPLSVPRKAEMHRNVSEVYSSMGNHALAVREAKDAIRLDPRAAKHYARLGDAHAFVGKVVPAIKSYERALEIDPKATPIRRAVAQQYMIAGDFRRAAAVYRTLVEADRRDVEGQYELANALERAGDTQPAIVAYQATLALDPKRFDALVAMGRLYRKKKEYEVSLHNLQKAIVVNDQVPAAYEELGYTYALLGEKDQALDAYQHAVALDPESISARRGLGKMLLARGDGSQALKELTETVNRFPTDGEAHYFLAAAYCRAGDGERASEHFDLAAKYRYKESGYLLVVVDKGCLKQQRLPAGQNRRSTPK